MKKMLVSLLCVSLLSVASLLGCFREQSRKIDGLISHIINHPKRTLRHQTKLINVIQNCKTFEGIKPRHLQNILTALAHRNTIPAFAPHKEKLAQSAHLFFATPGFLPVIKRAIEGLAQHKEHQLQGSVYELEKALEIIARNDEEIIEFNKKVRGSFLDTYNAGTLEIEREIDIVTSHRWIECKNIKKINKDKIALIKKQILGQQLMAEDNNMKYIVYFKHDIPQELQEWLIEQSICYRQD